MIKILHIHTLPVISGSGINTFLSMQGMDRKIFKTDLACAPGGRLINLARDNGLTVITFKNLVQPLDPLRDLLALIDLTRFLKRNKYHIVHTHNSKAGFIGRLAARLAGVPVIIHTVHGFAFHDEEPLWRQWLFKRLEILASRWCDKMIFISQPLIDWALREGIAKREKIVKIYSGIDLETFHPMTADEELQTRKRWGINKDDAVIGIVSKLWEGKGHEVLIRAFCRIKKEMGNSKLVIVGEGELRGRLDNLVETLGLDGAVIFTGFQDDVSRVIPCFNVAALPSFFEGMGRVLLEAMAMGKPIVASRVGGIPDLVKDGVNGILTAPGDEDALYSALKRLLTDHELAERMGSEGKKMINIQFSSKGMVRLIRDLYVRQLKKNGVAIDH